MKAFPIPNIMMAEYNGKEGNTKKNIDCDNYYSTVRSIVWWEKYIREGSDLKEIQIKSNLKENEYGN